MRETARHQTAFEIYFGLGPGRSLGTVAAKLSVSAAAVKNWSREFSWQTRLEEREQAVAHVVEKKSMRTEVDRRTRNERIVEAGIVAAARAIADGKIRPTLADLDRLVRLESFLQGEPDSRTELIERDLRGKTTGELRELVRTELQQLRDLIGAEDATFELDGEGEPN